MNKMLVAVLASFAFSSVVMAANADVRGACENDIKSLCAGVQPGGGRIKSCIKEHRDQLSSGCKSALIEQAKSRNRDSSAAPDVGH